MEPYEMDCLYLSASPHAVDASLVSKDIAVIRYSQENGIPLHQVAAIGDGANDLPFLSIPDLAIIGCPGNAQNKIKNYLKDRQNSFISKRDGFEGFKEFYDICSQSCISTVFSDRDGVIINKGYNEKFANELDDIFTKSFMLENPSLKILTGSSYDQNIMIVKIASHRKYARRYSYADPFLVLAENGSIQINVFDGSIKKLANVLNVDYLHWLKSEFQTEFVNSVNKTILHKYDLAWSKNHIDFIEALYIPKKTTMVTIDLPRFTKDGKDYGKTIKGKSLSKELLEIMEDIAIRNNLIYKIL